VASFIPCIVRLIDAKSNCKNFVYKINPIYDDKIIFNIKVECIIRANLVHIISAIVKIIKEWRREENGRKSSNRRTYGHCYE
jgi:hypothetical protein